MKGLFTGTELHFSEHAFQHMLFRQNGDGFKKHDPGNYPAAHCKAKLILMQDMRCQQIEEATTYLQQSNLRRAQ